MHTARRLLTVLSSIKHSTRQTAALSSWIYIITIFLVDKPKIWGKAKNSCSVLGLWYWRTGNTCSYELQKYYTTSKNSTNICQTPQRVNVMPIFYSVKMQQMRHLTDRQTSRQTDQSWRASSPPERGRSGSKMRIVVGILRHCPISFCT